MENKIKNEQEETPYLDALKKYVSENVSPFDVPGHHMGNVPNDFKDFVGEMTYKCDVNAPRGLDNLNHPHGVICKAQELMAKAFKADESFFLINGTSAGIMAMILATCSAHQKIIVPRNCHKSCINGLVLSGATPIFITPEYDYNLELDVEKCLTLYDEVIKGNLQEDTKIPYHLIRNYIVQAIGIYGSDVIKNNFGFILYDLQFKDKSNWPWGKSFK